MFLARVPAHLRVERAILYGSRARGDNRPDSDADLVLILSDHGDDWDTLWMLGGLAFDVLLETGIFIQPVTANRVVKESGSLCANRCVCIWSGKFPCAS